MVLPPILLLIGISAVGPLVLNGVLPANTAVMAEFNTRYGVAQLVLTVFLLATLFGQIFLGSAADRFGRRPIMLLSLAGFSVGGFLCALAPQMEWLLAARFVQGFFASACTVLPRTMVRDVYGRDKSASMIGYMTVAMMVAPLFGPALGGWVTDNFNWRFLYAGLGVAGAVFCFFCVFFLHETQSSDAKPANGFSILTSSRDLLQLRAFIASALMLCGSIGLYYAFLAGAPFVMMESRGFSASVYGAWFAMVASGYLTGNLIAGRFSERLGIDRMIFFGAIPGMTAVALLWLFSSAVHPLSLFAPMFLVALSNGMSLPSVMSAAMSVRPDLISSAAGLAGAIQVGFGVVLTYILGLLLPYGEYWLFVLMSFSAAIWMIGLWFWRALSKNVSTDHR